MTVNFKTSAGTDLDSVFADQSVEGGSLAVSEVGFKDSTGADLQARYTRYADGSPASTTKFQQAFASLDLNAIFCATGTVSGPSVSAVCDGDGNATSGSSANTCWVGVQFNINGNEYEYVGTTSTPTTNIGAWLDSGSASDVWVVFTLTSGTMFAGMTSGTRYNLGTTQTFYRSVTRTIAGTNTTTCSGYFQFYDAATGGNLLQRAPASGSSTYSASATVTSGVGGPGCPLCCFTPETQILMADTTKAIVDIEIGDMIQTIRGPEAVTGIIVRENRRMYRVEFGDGRHLNMSEDHPLYVKGKGYASINPDPSISYKDLGVPAQLGIGDNVKDSEGLSNKVVSITDLDYPETVYTLENTEFYANGLLAY